MSEAGCSPCRFNFRGGLNRGLSSIADVKAVAAWFTEPRDGKKPLASQVLLIGYSYGSIVAAAAAPDILECIGYVVLGPPLRYTWALYLGNGKHMLERAADSAGKPKLLTVGDVDIFTTVGGFEEFAETLPEPKTVVIQEEVDHFSLFRTLRGLITSWIRESFDVLDLREFASRGSIAGC
mmetsp:Transcript_50459/g.113470  ORF Transcript_50459/g.113470 Transcript_50459/m.113470 type:complete len:180 (-) Transcript_50459:27-566(-)